MRAVWQKGPESCPFFPQTQRQIGRSQPVAPVSSPFFCPPLCLLLSRNAQTHWRNSQSQAKSNQKASHWRPLLQHCSPTAKGDCLARLNELSACAHLDHLDHSPVCICGALKLTLFVSTTKDTCCSVLLWAICCLPSASDRPFCSPFARLFERRFERLFEPARQAVGPSFACREQLRWTSCAMDKQPVC